MHFSHIFDVNKAKLACPPILGGRFCMVVVQSVPIVILLSLFQHLALAQCPLWKCGNACINYIPDA
jgi:hypothetical protein